MESVELLREAIRIHGEGIPLCAVTVAGARGSIPQEIGAKAIIGSDGLICGTIGGGRVEARGIAKARELLTTDMAAFLETINLNRDLGMTCAGEMTLFYEVFRPDSIWRIVVFGAGHIAQRLCRFLTELDCRTICVDTRPEWIERLPENNKLEQRLVESYADGVGAVTPGAFVLAVTMGHATDVPVLQALSNSGVRAAFIGAVGSDSKAAVMRRELRERGVSEEFIKQIQCPVGEKIGGNTPPEIAVSILSQLVRLRGSNRQ
jgi:xanthine dehydrogenase accessory factor